MDDIAMLMLCMVPACVLCAMLGIGDAALEVIYNHCKPLRDRIDKQVEEYMEEDEK